MKFLCYNIFISKKIFNQSHTKTALKLAREGIVLLKNNDILPLRNPQNKKNKIYIYIIFEKCCTKLTNTITFFCVFFTLLKNQ